MAKKQKPQAKKIEPGMVVQATKGDLGEEDVSKPKVTDVVQDQRGEVEKLVVKKGIIFKKTVEIPADRIESVEHAAKQTTGTVTVDVSKHEAEALTAIGAEELPPEEQSYLFAAAILLFYGLATGQGS